MNSDRQTSSIQKAPRVSVLIPNYNHARFLEQRISTVVNQSYRDIEIILLDDASTDNSVAILDSFRDDPRVRTIYNEENSGSAFKQWNRGVAQASGEYIWIAESDDYTHHDFLSVLVKCLDCNPDVGLTYSDSWLVDEAGKCTGSYFDRPQVQTWVNPCRWSEDFVVNGREECADRLILLNTIPNASAVLFRKSVFLEAGGADESYTMAGDWVMWSRMLLISNLAYVSRRLNFWRQHPLCVQQSASRTGLDVEEIFRATAGLLHQLELTSNQLEKVCTKLARFWYWSWYRLFPRVPLARTYRVYRLARAMDDRLFRRLFNCFRVHCFGRLDPAARCK